MHSYGINPTDLQMQFLLFVTKIDVHWVPTCICLHLLGSWPTPWFPWVPSSWTYLSHSTPLLLPSQALPWSLSKTEVGLGLVQASLIYDSSISCNGHYSHCWSLCSILQFCQNTDIRFLNSLQSSSISSQYCYTQGPVTSEFCDTEKCM